MKRSLDFYRTSFGKGYLIYQNGVLTDHYLPGCPQPAGEYQVPRKKGIIAHKMEAYFEGKEVVFDDRIKVDGSAFQEQVWAECRKIPYGEQMTYAELASDLDSKAFRAVGKALGDNRIPIIIPCHRVVAANGPGGWSGPKGMKEVLLGLERRYGKT